MQAMPLAPRGWQRWNRTWINVYVKVFTNSPLLVCMDLSLSQEEIIDPKYLWIGPDGKNLEGQTYANLTETGKLMLMGFKESMSGAYTCTLSHRIIETMTQEEVDVFETYKFMLYGKITYSQISFQLGKKFK
uniref:Zona-pellucida-binding protein 1/2 N-terminal domain-containing protein n=1 Tax=Anas platyrhynchos platyrhynchos TaxID=8840 RepID=A0A493TJN0_ANAPP